MNTIQLDHFLAALWRSSLAAGVVVMLVFLAQWIFRAQLPPRWRSTLWLLVAVRLLLPISFSSATSIFNFLPHWTASAPQPVTTATPSAPAITPSGLPAHSNVAMALPTQPKLAPHSQTWSWQHWAFAAWLAGAVSLAAYILISSLRFKKHCATLNPCATPAVLSVFADCCQQFNIQTPPQLLESNTSSSPALYGIFRPQLLLPKGFADRFSPAEMRFIFLHELAHLKRLDLPMNWLLVALQVVHWFNPLVWLGFARWRADRELACDAMALEIAGADQCRDYGRTVLRLLEMITHPISTPGLVGILENKRQLRQRIEMIARPAAAPGWPRLALFLTLALAVIGLTDARSAAISRLPETVVVGQSQVAQQLIGTWVLVGEPGKVHKAPSAGGRYKFFTGDHWCISQADAKTGVVIFHHGGTYKVDGNEYFESVEFANSSTITHVGNKNRFKMKIEGDTLTQIGDGNPWREVWKRVPTKENGSALQSEQSLIGTWAFAGNPNDKSESPDSHRLKLITSSGWCDTQSDPKTSVVIVHQGGEFTLKGDQYVEHIKYANPDTMNLIGESAQFDLKLDGDTLHLTGLNNPWNEIWKRVK